MIRKRLLHKFLTLITCLVCLSSFGAQNPFTYKHKNIKVPSDYEFRRYIRPQLRSIVSEYYQILKLIGNENILIKLFSIKRGLIDGQTFLRQYRDRCENIQSDDCFQQILAIYNKLSTLETALLTWPKESQLKSIHITSSLILKIKIILDNSLGLLSTYQSSYLPTYNNIHTFTKQLNELALDYELLLTRQFSPDLRPSLSLAYFNFIKTIEQDILPTNNGKILIRNLKDLNFTWNRFHMKLAKESTKTDKKVIRLLKTGHNRWNSILKIILR